MLPAALRAQLAEIVGPAHVLDDPDLTAGYEVDWTGRFRGQAAAVVRPGSTAEVVAVVTLLGAASRPVVAQGGNTGLVGGGVPLHGEVVLSLRRLDGLGPVDLVAGQVTAGAGVTLAAVDGAAAAAGLAFGVDLAARDSATVGGMVATNAGGLRMLRYGPMRAQVMGVEAVLGDGSVVSHLGGLPKDNTGYDLGSLLTGSEGTLGVVTAVRLRLVPRLAARTTGLLAFASTDDALSALAVVRRNVPNLEAAELFFPDGVDLVCRHLNLPIPFLEGWSPSPPGGGGSAAPAARDPAGEVAAYLLLEAAAQADPTEELAAAVVDGVGDLALAGAVDSEPAARARLWRYREAHTEAINAAGVPVKLDISLPFGELAGFVPRVRTAVGAACPGARAILFGHAADGNLHVNVLGAAGEPGQSRAVEETVLTLVADLGGSISAEHGIGTAKRPWLHLNRSPAELAAFAAIKRALDPAGILNPHVLLPET